MIELRLTEQDIQGLTQVIDLALKSGGVAVLDHVMILTQKIRVAVAQQQARTSTGAMSAASAMSTTANGHAAESSAAAVN